MKKKIKIIFWGSDNFSVFVLEKIVKNGLPITAIITGPDTPQGRNLKPTSPIIVGWAKEKKIKYYQLSDHHSFNWNILQPFKENLFIIASYGKIIPKDILNKAELGTLNIHPSLLPKYRGPSPIQSAILNNEKKSGVTLMLMDERMDHGPIIRQEETNIYNKNYEELIKEMGNVGGKLILENLEDYLCGKINPKPQNHLSATYTKKITPNDGQLNLNSSYEKLKVKILALSSKPGVFFILDSGKEPIRVKINQVKIEDNKIIINRVTPAGRKEMTGKDFLNFLASKDINLNISNFVRFV